jgi:hypothetical protein
VRRGRIFCLSGEVLAELCSRQECNRCVDWKLIMKKFIRLKMSSDELQQYLIFKHRGSRVEAKKGKGSSYNRREACKIPKEF